jgi:hypothetical protein
VALSFAVVCEAPADQATSCDLADRVFCQEVDWIEHAVLSQFREWRGLHSADPCLFWRRVPDLARSNGIKAHGHFDGQPGAPDGVSTRRAILVLLAVVPHLDAVVLLRDDDRQSARRLGMEQARNESSLRDRIVIGLAHPMRECWVLAGFDPQDEEESCRFAEVRREIGFDPREKAGQLTARHDSDKRSPKRVLRVLTNGDATRQAECWQKAALEVLIARGRNTGLADYLKEVRTYLVPLLSARPLAQ